MHGDTTTSFAATLACPLSWQPESYRWQTALAFLSGRYTAVKARKKIAAAHVAELSMASADDYWTISLDVTYEFASLSEGLSSFDGAEAIGGEGFAAFCWTRAVVIPDRSLVPVID